MKTNGASRRVKPPVNIEPVKDIAQANTVLAELAGLKRQMVAIETELNEDIDRLKQTAEAKSAPLQRRIDLLTNGLVAFVTYNRDMFSGARRSIEMNFGTIGCRRSTRLSPKTKWADALQAAKRLSFTEVIKFKEELDKEALERWPDERLDLVGVRRETRDEVWFELKAENVGGGR